MYILDQYNYFFSRAHHQESMVAFLPTMNVVSGLFQEGELTCEQSIKVQSST